jgi:hypothetical protein
MRPRSSASPDGYGQAAPTVGSDPACGPADGREHGKRVRVGPARPSPCHWQLDAPSLRPLSQQSPPFVCATAPWYIECRATAPANRKRSTQWTCDTRNRLGHQPTRPCAQPVPAPQPSRPARQSADSRPITTGKTSSHRGCEPRSRAPGPVHTPNNYRGCGTRPVGSAGANLGIAALIVTYPRGRVRPAHRRTRGELGA